MDSKWSARYLKSFDRVGREARKPHRKLDQRLDGDRRNNKIITTDFFRFFDQPSFHATSCRVFGYREAIPKKGCRRQGEAKRRVGVVL